MNIRLYVSIIAVLTVSLTLTINNSYAAEVTVSIPEGAALANCTQNLDDIKCYNPGILTIDKGTTVTWKNDDPTASHTVTSGVTFVMKGSGPDGKFDSSLIAPNASWSFTFNEVGEFPYFCSLHPLMVGKVIVQEGTAQVENRLVITSDPALPYDRTTNQAMTLTIKPDSGDIVGKKLTYHVEILNASATIWDGILDATKGILELHIMPGDGEVSVSEAEEVGDNTRYHLSGAIFNTNGDYNLRAEVIAIDGEQVEPTTKQEFSISVVPEFPLAAILPMIVGFSAVLALLRMKRINI
ncbi:MAG: plastocyanin/azurin family copper-binding protein [Candidatus Nitrosocaldaceae archaeon]